MKKQDKKAAVIVTCAILVSILLIFSIFSSGKRLLKNIFWTGKPLHTESEIAAAVDLLLPGAVLDGKEETNTEKKFGGSVKYHFTYRDISFTFEEKNTRSYFILPGPFHNEYSDDYYEKVMEKFSEDYLRGLVDREVSVFDGRLGMISCRVDSYDELSAALDDLHVIYSELYDYLPATESGDIWLKRFSIALGLFCPTDKVAVDDISTRPTQENYGHIIVTSVSTREDSFETDALTEMARKKYRELMDLGYVTDPVLTPDKPFDTEADVFNNRYITAIYIDGKKFTPAHDRKYEFIYDEATGLYMAKINLSIYDFRGQLEDEQDVLYDLVTQRYENAGYTSKHADDDILDSYSMISYMRGEDRIRLRDDPSYEDRLFLYVNGERMSVRKRSGIKDAGGIVSKFIDIYDTAELAGLSVEMIDEESGAVWFSSDMNAHPNKNDHTFTYSEKPSFLEYLYVNGEQIHKNTDSIQYMQLGLVYNEDDGEYYCRVSIYTYDMYLLAACYKACCPGEVMELGDDLHLRFEVGGELCELYPKDEETLMLVTKSGERKLLTYQELRNRHANGKYEYYIRVSDMADMLDLKIDHIDPEEESMYLVSK